MTAKSWRGRAACRSREEPWLASETGRRVAARRLQNGDVNILLPWLMVSAIFIFAFNLLADLLYGLLDPRTRLA